MSNKLAYQTLLQYGHLTNISLTTCPKTPAVSASIKLLQPSPINLTKHQLYSPMLIFVVTDILLRNDCSYLQLIVQVVKSMTSKQGHVWSVRETSSVHRVNRICALCAPTTKLVKIRPANLVVMKPRQSVSLVGVHKPLL